MPDDSAVWGVLALMLLHDSRRDARVDDRGRWVGLEEQDRSRWDQGRIREGMKALERSVLLGGPGLYQLQAAIAAVHVQPGEPDWQRLAELYRALERLTGSPVVAVQHATAVGLGQSPEAGLELLAPLLDDARLASYQPLHAAHAELLRRAGDRDGAEGAYRRAIELSANAVERAELEARLARLLK
jgi:RNA polymerase sigma-70 factor (ECF subfamily)